jgi:esterase/lipase superfamily enzyme
VLADDLKVRERWYSSRMEQQVTVVRWGLFGRPVLVFPSAGGDAEEIERHGLVDACGPLLAEGRVKLYSVDSVAGRAMAAREGSVEHRMWLLNQFQECVRWEVLPAVRADLGGSSPDVVTAGASIGAFNAVAMLCRYPDVFGAAIGMSGTYRVERFYDEAWSQDLYFSAPLQFLPGLEGAQLDVLRTRFAVLASGQGEWEDIGESWRMAEALGTKGIPNRVDNWGPQWAHQWPTWRHMLPQYLRELIPLSALSAGDFLGDDLVAQGQALRADGRELRGRPSGPGGHGGQAGRLGAVLAAEAAPQAEHVLRHGLHRAERGAGRLTGADHGLSQRDAPVADVHARAGDQLADLLLRLHAERALQPRLGQAAAGASGPAAGAAGLLDDLVHPLVAQAQGRGDLAQRRAAQVQAPDGPVELRAGHLEVTFGVDQLLLGEPGLGEQVIVHRVYCN